MRLLSKVPAEEHTEIDRHEMSATGKSAGAGRKVTNIEEARITFGDLARFACPRKTAAWLAHIAKCDVRTCERWLSGRNEPPAEAFGAVMFEIMRRYQMRVSQ
jgi:hypothetical protein